MTVGLFARMMMRPLMKHPLIQILMVAAMLLLMIPLFLLGAVLVSVLLGFAVLITVVMAVRFFLMRGGFGWSRKSRKESSAPRQDRANSVIEGEFQVRERREREPSRRSGNRYR